MQLLEKNWDVVACLTLSADADLCRMITMVVPLPPLLDVETEAAVRKLPKVKANS